MRVMYLALSENAVQWGIASRYVQKMQRVFSLVVVLSTLGCAAAQPSEPINTSPVAP